MAIVPVGKLSLQVPRQRGEGFVREIIDQMQGMAVRLASRVIEESMETELDRFLERGKYVRRKRSKRKESRVYCSKCGSHQRQDFRRNGHYQRGLTMRWGRVRVEVPQVKCRCGGNVRFEYQTIRPRQRIWDDLNLEIQAEYGRGLSYRQIKVDLDQRLRGSVALSTLNRRVLWLGSNEGSCMRWEKGEAPPHRAGRWDLDHSDVCHRRDAQGQSWSGSSRQTRSESADPGCPRGLADYGTYSTDCLDTSRWRRRSQLAEVPGDTVRSRAHSREWTGHVGFGWRNWLPGSLRECLLASTLAALRVS